jgi:hypothetical protein
MTVAAEVPFSKTKLIIVVDRFILMNGLGQDIEVRQCGMEDVISVSPHREQPMWWRPGKQTIQVRLSKLGSSCSGWSGQLSPLKPGETIIRLCHDRNNTVAFISIAVVKQGPRICVVFKCGESSAPYRIENHTLQTFRLRQQVSHAPGGYGAPTPLLPYHACPYAWDEPLSPQILSLEEVKSNVWTAGDSEEHTDSTLIGLYSLAKLLSYPPKNNVIVRVIAVGPVRVMQILDPRSATISPLIHAQGGYSPTSTSSVNIPSTSVNQKVAEVKLHVALNVKSVGLSFIDHTPQELLYLSVDQITIDHLLHSGEDSLQVTIGRVQLDNQLWGAPYPCLFYPLRSPEQVSSSNNGGGATTATDVISKPFVSLEIRRDFTHRGAIVIPLLRLGITPFDVNLEGTIISRIVKMSFVAADLFQSSNRSNSGGHIARGSGSRSNKHRNYNDLADLLYPPVLDTDGTQQGPPAASSVYSSSVVDADSADLLAVHGLVSSALQKASPSHKLYEPGVKVYLQQLIFSEIKLNVSFNPVVMSSVSGGTSEGSDGSGGTTGLEDIATGGAYGDSNSPSTSLIVSALGTLLKAIGSTLAKIDNCPLRFQSYELKHAFLDPLDLSLVLVSHYGTQAVGQAYLILGSSDALGNPVKFFNTLGEGVWDFMYLPVSNLL